MPSSDPAGRRPYLVIPKLIEQPTWGGHYIVHAKGWQDRGNLGQTKIGQAYELFSASNLSLLDSTDDPAFQGELTNNLDADRPTSPAHSIPLARLIEDNASATLGATIAEARGGRLNLLIKFTQALGNSFQTHIKADLSHPRWKPKPESWYYFEPGLITLGIKPGADWAEYERVLRDVAAGMEDLSAQVKSGALTYEQAQDGIKDLLARRNPWDYVNAVPTDKDDLVDLSAGGLHHSWEEDPERSPLGNVLLELQSEAMDDISTFRGFDKGKMAKDGKLRPIQVNEYFEFVDRSPEANDPSTHLRQARTLESTPDHRFDRLMETPFYSLDRLDFTSSSGRYHSSLDTFKHLFVKSGRITVAAGGHTVTVGEGHSAFVPASAGEYEVQGQAPDTQVLISY